MIKRETSALLLGEKIYLIVFQKTESVPAPTDQIVELHISDDSCYIGLKVKEALMGFILDKVKYGREEWKKAYEPQLERLKFKSIKKMFDSVKIVNIFSRDSNLYFLPYRNCGYNKIKTKSLDDQMLYADLYNISDCELGQLLVQSFEIATLEV